MKVIIIGKKIEIEEEEFKILKKIISNDYKIVKKDDFTVEEIAQRRKTALLKSIQETKEDIESLEVIKNSNLFASQLKAYINAICTGSSAAAEIVAICDNISNLITPMLFEREFFNETQFTYIHEDSSSCIVEIKKQSGKKMRYLCVKTEVVRSHIEKGDIELIQIPAEQQLADIMIKPIISRLFMYFHQYLVI